MHTQDLVNEAAKKFIRDLNGKEFTVQDFRNIIFGNCNQYIVSSKKEGLLLDFVRHPSVQLRGVGMNGIIMDKFIKDVTFEKDLWHKHLMEELTKNK